MPDSSARVTIGQALAVYAESLVSGRRVVVIGDATDDVAARLVDLGARVVHVYDPDAGRAAAARAPRGTTVRALPDGELDVRDGAFDVALVPDLGIAPDPAALLARVRRVVGAEGVAVVAARNPDSATLPEGARAVDYYALYDMVSLQFAAVRMLGQVAFHGLAIAELGDADDAPQVSVDTQLARESGAPDVFIALAAQRDVRLEPYAIVQVPHDDAARESEAASAAVADAIAVANAVNAAAANAALAEAQLRAELLATQVEEQRARARELEARAGDNHVRAERAGHDLRALEEELQRQRDRAFRLTRDLEEEKKLRTKLEIELGMIRRSPELAAARNRVSDLEEALRAAEVVVAALQARVAELEAIAGTATAAARQLPDLVAELEATRAIARAGEEATQQLAELAERAERIEQRAVAYEVELSRHGEANAEELAQLEEALRERAKAIQELEREVHRRERMVQELVAALEDAHTEQGAAMHAPAQVPAARMTDEENLELRRKLDALAAEVARREADSQAASWRIAELEQAVAARTSQPAPPDDGQVAALRDQLAAARDELDVLRQALAQEHEARKRSESGAELASARAELARQAALIEQLSSELAAAAGPLDGARSDNAEEMAR